MDQIREDLDLLQASVVPDPDAAAYQKESISENAHQTSSVPFGVGNRSDEAPLRTSFTELEDEDKEVQEASTTIVGRSRTIIPQPNINTLNDAEQPQYSRSVSDHGGPDEDSSTDVERGLAKSGDDGPLEFLYDMFSHL